MGMLLRRRNYGAVNSVPVNVIEKGKTIAVEEVKNIEPVEEYTKTDINRLSKADLVELAEKVGIAFDEETSGSELKRLLIEHYGL